MIMAESRWLSLGSYGKTNHKMIKKLEKLLDKETDHKKIIDITKTISYVISTQVSLVKVHNDFSIDKRFNELEKKMNGNGKI